MEAGHSWRQTLSVLRPGPFRRYMIGETISVTGTWMQVMAQSWVMTNLTQSAFMLGMVQFASGIPMLLLSTVGGTMADRHDKRSILFWTQVVQILCAVGTGILVLKDTIALWHVLVMAVILGVAGAFEMPAASALVPELVEPDEIASAMAIDRSTFHATRLVGPALAGMLIGWWGTASAFFANAISFLALMVAVRTLHPRPVGTPEEEAQRQGGIKEGWAYVRSDVATLSMIMLCAMSTVCVFPIMMILMPLYARQELGLVASGMGGMMSAAAIGSLSGSIALLRVPRDRRQPVMLVVAMAAALGIVAMAVATQPLAAGAALAVMSGSISVMIGLANTTVQERTPGPLRGRVSAIAGISFFGLMPFAGLGVSSLADQIGIRPAMGLAAVVFALGASFVLLGPARKANEAVPETALPVEMS